MRILLADDHTLIRETLSAFLKILDPEVEVFEAPGLKEADAIAAREPDLDLIILDLVMPGMDGLAGGPSYGECLSRRARCRPFGSGWAGQCDQRHERGRPRLHPQNHR